jgi:hypothetical protein
MCIYVACPLKLLVLCLLLVFTVTECLLVTRVFPLHIRIPANSDICHLCDLLLIASSCTHYSCIISFVKKMQTISYMAERVVGTGSFGIVFQVRYLDLRQFS